MVSPEESITTAKQRRVIRAARHYLLTHAALERSWRIDVVLIEVDDQGSVQRLDHWRSVTA
jgi:Holliday junction resolvase-like predicted endonuclease